MKINIHHSGSTGNLYSIDDGETKLLVECGVPIAKIKKAVGYKLSEFSGCIVTHEHKDHCASVKELCKLGLHVYALVDVFDSLNFINFYANVIEPGKPFIIGSFKIIPFEVVHDVKNVGFLIISKHGYKVLFATDCYKVIPRFKGLTHIMIECSYDADILQENVKKGIIHPTQRKRVLNSHMELMECQKFLNANISDATEEVYLIHQSQTNLGE